MQLIYLQLNAGLKNYNEIITLNITTHIISNK